MSCHVEIRKESANIQALAALPKDAKPFPQTRVFRIADFVFFSHARHTAAQVECAKCHGAVMTKEIVTRDFPLNMKFCVDCHKANAARTTCNACHELNQ